MRKIAHLAVVHCETTTGMLNPIKEIGDLCKKYEINLIVDAMSSFAAIPIDMKEMNIGYLAASSNKNLQGMAGVSFIIAECQRLHNCKKNQTAQIFIFIFMINLNIFKGHNKCVSLHQYRRSML